jgi:hypothetical protein
MEVASLSTGKAMRSATRHGKSEERERVKSADLGKANESTKGVRELVEEEDNNDDDDDYVEERHKRQKTSTSTARLAPNRKPSGSGKKNDTATSTSAKDDDDDEEPIDQPSTPQARETAPAVRIVKRRGRPPKDKSSASGAGTRKRAGAPLPAKHAIVLGYEDEVGKAETPRGITAAKEPRVGLRTKRRKEEEEEEEGNQNEESTRKRPTKERPILKRRRAKKSKHDDLYYSEKDLTSSEEDSTTMVTGDVAEAWSGGAAERGEGEIGQGAAADQSEEAATEQGTPVGEPASVGVSDELNNAHSAPVTLTGQDTSSPVTTTATTLANDSRTLSEILEYPEQPTPHTPAGDQPSPHEANTNNVATAKVGHAHDESIPERSSAPAAHSTPQPRSPPISPRAPVPAATLPIRPSETYFGTTVNDKYAAQPELMIDHLSEPVLGQNLRPPSSNGAGPTLSRTVSPFSALFGDGLDVMVDVDGEKSTVMLTDQPYGPNPVYPDYQANYFSPVSDGLDPGMFDSSPLFGEELYSPTSTSAHVPTPPPPFLTLDGASVYYTPSPHTKVTESEQVPLPLPVAVEEEVVASGKYTHNMSDNAPAVATLARSSPAPPQPSSSAPSSSSSSHAEPQQDALLHPHHDYTTTPGTVTTPTTTTPTSVLKSPMVPMQEEEDRNLFQNDHTNAHQHRYCPLAAPPQQTVLHTRQTMRMTEWNNSPDPWQGRTPYSAQVHSPRSPNFGSPLPRYLLVPGSFRVHSSPTRNAHTVTVQDHRGTQLCMSTCAKEMRSSLVCGRQLHTFSCSVADQKYAL